MPLASSAQKFHNCQTKGIDMLEFIKKVWLYEVGGFYVSALVCGGTVGIFLGNKLAEILLPIIFK